MPHHSYVAAWVGCCWGLIDGFSWILSISISCDFCFSKFIQWNSPSDINTTDSNTKWKVISGAERVDSYWWSDSPKRAGTPVTTAYHLTHTFLFFTFYNVVNIFAIPQILYFPYNVQLTFVHYGIQNSIMYHNVWFSASIVQTFHVRNCNIFQMFMPDYTWYYGPNK